MPSATARPAELDRIVLAALKEVHNQGAELYNRGDHAGALRLYQGGLLVARPLLDHRAKQQAEIGDGLDQVAKSNADGKLKAFRLHEVIEQVRADLKEELRHATLAEQPAEAAASGSVTRAGRPAENVLVAFVPVHTTTALVTARTAADGTFHAATTLPAGTFLVTLAGEGVPSRLGRPETTPLRAELKAGVNSLTFVAE